MLYFSFIIFFFFGGGGGVPGGFCGNKGTWPFTFREQGNRRKIKLRTREQKHILGNREHQNGRNTQLREHGNTRKILLGTREHGLALGIILRSRNNINGSKDDIQHPNHNTIADQQ